MDNENENIDSLNNEDEQSIIADIDNSDEQDIDVDKLLETNKKLYSRAKKAEEEARKYKQLIEKEKTVEVKPKVETKTNESSLTKEEIILFAKGYSIEEVERIKKIALLDDTNPLVAEQSDLFKTWKSQEDKKKQDETSELDTSKGSPRFKKAKSFSDPSLSPEEHRKLWEKSMGR